MRTGWIFLAVAIVATGWNSELRAEEENGMPLLPSGALIAVAHPSRGLELTTAGLARTGEIRWESETEERNSLMESAPLFSRFASSLAMEGESPLSASLLQKPSISPIPGGPAPRNCGPVRRELQQVRRWVGRVSVLRPQIEAKLKRAQRNCRHDCDWSDLDSDLAELNRLLAQLLEYSETESRAMPDRLVHYTFHLDESEGIDFLEDGLLPKGSAELQRLRFVRSGWLAVPAPGFGQEWGFQAPPAAVGRNWIVSRALSASRACTGLPLFRMEFMATFEGPSTAVKRLISATAL